MAKAPLETPARQFTGRRARESIRKAGLDAVADVLLSERPGAAPASAAMPPALSPDPLRGLYVLVPAGVEPAARRRTALAVACRLAPGAPRCTSGLFVFQNGRADAHVLGEPACGRLGPENYLASADLGRTVGGLLSQCEQVGVILLDSVTAAPGALERAARRTVFVATPDAESLVETYREMKSWRARDGRRGTNSNGPEAGVFVVGSRRPAEAHRLHDRLRRAARRFLDCDVSIEGFMEAEGEPGMRPWTEPLRLFSEAPAADVWPHLLAAATVDRPAGRDVHRGDAPAEPTPAPAPQRSACAAMAVWQPAETAALLDAIEVQAPALLFGRCRSVFRVDVAEADAPPLVAVRDDGAMVAILIEDGGGRLDTAAAKHWLNVHRPLLARAYPEARIAPEPEPSAIVLTPLEAAPADGKRRFLPVKAGGRHGIVLVP
ncbi:MAG TPA: hypothetical protein VM219_03985 [Phycisphaerae bacterium]|nr:hypothetical protein [Phycisphaerae bacterium]